MRCLDDCVVLALALRGGRLRRRTTRRRATRDTVVTDTTTDDETTDETTTDETTTDDDGELRGGDCQELVTASCRRSARRSRRRASGDGGRSRSRKPSFEEFADECAGRDPRDSRCSRRRTPEYVDVLADVDLEAGRGPGRRAAPGAPVGARVDRPAEVTVSRGVREPRDLDDGELLSRRLTARCRGSARPREAVRRPQYLLSVKVLGIDPGTAACGYGIVHESDGRLRARGHRATGGRPRARGRTDGCCDLRGRAGAHCGARAGRRRARGVLRGCRRPHRALRRAGARRRARRGRVRRRRLR